MNAKEMREVIAQIKREERELNDKVNTLIIKRLKELDVIGGKKNGNAILIKYRGTSMVPVAIWMDSSRNLYGAFRFCSKCSGHRCLCESDSVRWNKRKIACSANFSAKKHVVDLLVKREQHVVSFQELEEILERDLWEEILSSSS